MYDANEPGAVVNEFLLTVFVPGIVAFVSIWTLFRLVLHEHLLAVGLEAMVPRSGAGTLSAGYGRFLLAVVLTVAVLLPYVAVYRRFLRQPLRERGYV